VGVPNLLGRVGERGATPDRPSQQGRCTLPQSHGRGAMTRNEALSRLGALLGQMQRHFRVRSLRVFGSTARDAAHSASDIDVLVDFDGPVDFDSFMGLKGYLEDSLCVDVDLVTEKALGAPLRPGVEREAVRGA
jgi:uncharacterized protein